MRANTGWGLAAVLVAGWGIVQLSQPETVSARAAVKVAAAPVPVEEDMHEFMEYVFEPTFQRLKAAMAQEPADGKGWKPIKAESLVLAEGGNLTLLRGPSEEKAAWDELCVQVREHGKALYTAGRKRDFAAARESYVAMVKSCNACHMKFAGGEHILEP